MFGTEFANNELPARGTPLEIGKGRIVKRRAQHTNQQNSQKVACNYRVSLLSIGTRLHDCVLAARAIEATYPDVSVGVADARFMKPLDEEMIGQLATESNVLITVEEGSIGGFGSHVLNFLINNKLNIYKKLLIETIQLPDEFIDQDTPEKMYYHAKMNSTNIVKRVLKRLGF